MRSRTARAPWWLELVGFEDIGATSCGSNLRRAPLTCYGPVCTFGDETNRSVASGGELDDQGRATGERARAVVVFGATGHTGRFVVAELVRRGMVPIAVARDREKLA